MKVEFPSRFVEPPKDDRCGINLMNEVCLLKSHASLLAVRGIQSQLLGRYSVQAALGGKITISIIICCPVYNQEQGYCFLLIFLHYLVFLSLTARNSKSAQTRA